LIKNPATPLHFAAVYDIAATPAQTRRRQRLSFSCTACDDPFKGIDMTTLTPANEKTAASPIVDALDKNKQAAETVEQAAHDLAVVHAVLDKEVPREVRKGDVGQAVNQTSELEKRLTESVELLQEVNQTLVAELESRSATEDAKSF
jgi:hypothetical protein